jgi:hypothetical protein
VGLLYLTDYVIEHPEDDLLASKHVGAMEQRNRLINCNNSVHLLVCYAYRIIVPLFKRRDLSLLLFW